MHERRRDDRGDARERANQGYQRDFVSRGYERRGADCRLAGVEADSQIVVDPEFVRPSDPVGLVGDRAMVRADLEDLGSR